MHEFLRAQDATLLCAQDSATPLQIGAVCLFDAGPLLDEDGALRRDELRGHLAGRILASPRYRQRLQPVLGGLLPPVWVDDPTFDLTNHLHEVALASPGSLDELRGFASFVVQEPLDPTRPLWELWFVDGVVEDRVAVILKVSHVMADGIALVDFALSVLDEEPGGPSGPAELPAPRPPTPRGELARAALGERTRRRLGLVGGALAKALHPRATVDQLSNLVRAGRETVVAAPPLPITGPVGPHRDLGWTDLPLDELARVGRAHGAPLNDVVLAVAAGALRRHLLELGERVEGVVPRVLVPLSTRSADDLAMTNEFSFLVADLPVDVADPVERLRAVHAEMERRKGSAQRDLPPVLFGLSDVVPVSLLHSLGPVVLRHQPFVNLSVTDMPGTPGSLYLAGARLLELHPFVTVAGNVAMVIGVLSYAGRLEVGVTVDPDVVWDLDGFVGCIDKAGAELVAAT